MLQLTYGGLADTAGWEKAGVKLPRYDARAAAERTEKNPAWLHFGAGNIFRGYIAALAHKLLNGGLVETGVVPVEAFDTDIIGKIYEPFDSLALLVTLKADGGAEREIIGGMAKGITARNTERLEAMFADKGLQMVSFTITEKGYGESSPVMGLIASLLLRRYQNGAAPIAMVSMDNCSRNGERLKESVIGAARGMEVGFIEYLSDGAKVSYPWTMIDKITPRPADVICRALEDAGITGMNPVVTSKGTYIAAFVNAEEAEYLVIEDDFPNGRPPLERAGVYMTDRDTVNGVERMKVTTCLNPLHTALAVFGCLLGYDSISAEMRDPDLVELTRRIGYDEGLPVVNHPGIIEPRAFLDEVFTKRLPNPFIPDMPQRIATDTSQKVPIRFGETIKAYRAKGAADTLVGIPLAVAGWLRYLLAVDDELNPMELSGDPMLERLRGALKDVVIGCGKDVVKAAAEPLLRDSVLFASDLIEAGLGDKITDYFFRMTAGKGAVRAAVREVLGI